jgi:hypothetical protein
MNKMIEATSISENSNALNEFKSLMEKKREAFFDSNIIDQQKFTTIKNSSRSKAESLFNKMKNSQICHIGDIKEKLIFEDKVDSNFNFLDIAPILHEPRRMALDNESDR